MKTVFFLARLLTGRPVHPILNLKPDESFRYQASLY